MLSLIEHEDNEIINPFCFIFCYLYSPYYHLKDKMCNKLLLAKIWIYQQPLFFILAILNLSVSFPPPSLPPLSVFLCVCMSLCVFIQSTDFIENGFLSYNVFWYGSFPWTLSISYLPPDPPKYMTFLALSLTRKQMVIKRKKKTINYYSNISLTCSVVMREALSCRRWEQAQSPTTGQCSESEILETLSLI